MGVAAAREVPGRGRNSASLFAGNRKLKANFTCRAKLEQPLGVSGWFGKKRNVETSIARDGATAEVPQAAAEDSPHSKETHAVTSLAQCRQNMSNHFPSSLLLALLMERKPWSTAAVTISVGDTKECKRNSLDVCFIES